MRAERLARVAVPGSAESMLAAGVAFLAPEEAVLEAMLAGWIAQQTSRLLAATTIEQRVLLVRRLVKFSNDYPWSWTASDVEEWTTALVGRGLAHSTLRNYQMAVQLFCSYVTDRRYGWDEVCEQRFGTHPVQVIHEWNSAAHRDQNEARPGNRPLSRKELQTLFDYSRRAGRDDHQDRPEGLARRLPGRRAVQDRLRLRAAPSRGSDAGRG